MLYNIESLCAQIMGAYKYILHTTRGNYIVGMCFNRSYFEQVIGIMINGHGVQPQTPHAKSSRAIAAHYYCNLRAVQKGILQKLYVL